VDWELLDEGRADGDLHFGGVNRVFGHLSERAYTKIARPPVETGQFVWTCLSHPIAVDLPCLGKTPERPPAKLVHFAHTAPGQAGRLFLPTIASHRWVQDRLRYSPVTIDRGRTLIAFSRR
jgi:hypothetical protein